jgi:hypothetical protein
MNSRNTSFTKAHMPRLPVRLKRRDCCSTASLNSRGAILARSREITGRSLSGVTPLLESRNHTRNTLEGGQEQHTNTVLELGLAIVRDSSSPNHRELHKARNEVPDARSRRRVGPVVTRWTSADSVVTSSVDRSPSTSNSNFNLSQVPQYHIMLIHYSRKPLNTLEAHVHWLHKCLD